MKASHTLTTRQHRAVEALLSHRRVSTQHLRKMAGASNISELVKQIKAKGLDVQCERVPFTDRDGNTVYPGEYYLAPEARHDALRMLGKKENGAALTTPQYILSQSPEQHSNGDTP